MIRVAIVEDDEIFSTQLKEYLLRFGEEKNYAFSLSVYKNAINFLENYTADVDLVLLDIKMPYMNGMEAAKRLRELDESVALIFVTSLSQYAVEGYSVNASDYIIKPIGYYDFALKLSHALKRIRLKSDENIVINTEQGKIKLVISDISYVESRNHTVTYHVGDKIYTQRATLISIEKMLDENFVRCNNCFLVNLNFVKSIKDFIVVVGNDELQISHPRRTKFIKQFEDFVKYR